MPNAILSISNLSKKFGESLVLDCVGLTVMPGEIHGLLGHNGSGKSTLIKVLAGFHDPEPGGELEVSGKKVPLPVPPGGFWDLGISFVHQDLGLIPDLTVTENVFLNRWKSASRWHVSMARERKRVCSLFEEYGIDIDPDATVGALAPVDRALLAIARALEQMHVGSASHQESKGLLILDEPTVFLPKDSTDKLFSLMRDVAAGGAGVMFVSHDLDEVLEMTDCITVLRDGRVAGTANTCDLCKKDLIERIVGRAMHTLDVAPHDVSEKRVIASIHGLTGGRVENLSMDIHEGEILGLTGLLGSGFEDVPHLVFGAKRCSTGDITLDGANHSLVLMRPFRALGLGMGFVPADRPGEGAISTLTIEENIAIRVLKEYFRGGFLRHKVMSSDIEELLKRFDVHPGEPWREFSALSGGNQQKALLAKWLQGGPTLFLLHEPTQGVDVGAREQIFNILRELAEQGVSVVVASSDYEQVATICDRVAIFAKGKVICEVSGSSLTKEAVTALALTGGTSEPTDYAELREEYVGSRGLTNR